MASGAVLEAAEVMMGTSHHVASMVLGSVARALVFVVATKLIVPLVALSPE